MIRASHVAAKVATKAVSASRIQATRISPHSFSPPSLSMYSDRKFMSGSASEQLKKQVEEPGSGGFGKLKKAMIIESGPMFTGWCVGFMGSTVLYVGFANAVASLIDP